jgi:hypothetical protein
MPNFIFRCPRTGYNVQGYVADEVEDVSDDADTYESVTCPACGRVHLVNPKNGRVIGYDDE